MNGSRKVLLSLVALGVLARFMPVTRDEFSWFWAQAQDHAANYQQYENDWPHGRHAAEARVLYEQRHRHEAKKAEINLAVAAKATPATARSEEADHRAKVKRQDDFAWKGAAAGNSVESYNNYLQKFPQGRHAAEARQKLATPGLPQKEADQPSTVPNG